jgi:hypothetical protein
MLAVTLERVRTRVLQEIRTYVRHGSRRNALSPEVTFPSSVEFLNPTTVFVSRQVPLFKPPVTIFQTLSTLLVT